MDEEKRNQENEVVELEERIADSTPIKVLDENVNPVKPPKKNNGIVGILVTIIILLIAGLVYVLFFMNDNDKEKDKPQVTTTPEPSETIDVTTTPKPQNTEEPQDDGKNNELIVYKSSSGDLCIYNYCKEQKYGETEAFRIKVSSSDAKFLVVDDDNLFIVYDDNGIKIYDVKNKSIQNTTLLNKYEDYEIFVNDKKDKVLGIGFVDKDDYIGYYNASKGKSLYYDKKLKKDDRPFLYKVNDNYLSLSTDDYAYLLNANEEKIEMSYKYKESEGDWYSYWGEKAGKQNILVFGACVDECVIYKLYNNELKEFFSGAISEYEYSIYNENIYLNDSNVIKKYNGKGELLSTIDKYGEIEQIVNNYVLFVKDGNLVLENIDDPTENKNITKLDDSGFVDNLMTRYYSNEDLKELEENNKKEGLYVVIYYGTKDSNGNYGMEYCYTKDKQIVEYPIKSEMGGRAKPVLYLYPTKETNVKVEFAHPEYLTTTYPKYNKSWEVTAKPNGDLTDKDGKYYYALYWDETRYSETDFKEGFYVESRDAIKFLEEKLAIIGLSDKERNEFIMYWLPIMEKNGKNLVYFELTEERETNNKLIITPKPDSLLRVSIHIKKVNQKTNIKEQKLPTFNRVGFTAVEWGGMIY